MLSLLLTANKMLSVWVIGASFFLYLERHSYLNLWPAADGSGPNKPALSSSALVDDLLWLVMSTWI